MKQTNWPEVAPINQKNYYTYECYPSRAPYLRFRTNSVVVIT